MSKKKKQEAQTSFFDEPSDWLQVYHYWVDAPYELIPVDQSFDYDIVKSIMVKEQAKSRADVITK